MIIYAIRHPQAVWNVEKILQWHLDSPLTEHWRETAHKLWESLKDRNIGKIFSSDLGRCIETTGIINAFTDVPAILRQELRERDFWIYNGKEKSFVIPLFDVDDIDAAPPEGESQIQMKDRIISFLGSLSDSQESIILLVVHHGWITSLLSHAHDCPLNDPICKNKQGEIYKFKFENKVLSLEEVIVMD
ncbi:MAG: Phosphoglycerate/bisphosphoglycerate mutase [uncultured bacterium (gcode 4)]|uniref:Phosphoglycerate/bisphosphoglycerate mutase n=1 Tax=uncultured bacterium (gcode 4) TaxID=1234023 RepID=K2GWH1_9BACT|nr:MAG: Phosphoglycerate/bisphosphoglycerate mutase [uncultured bacterium (gcode 4)]